MYISANQLSQIVGRYQDRDTLANVLNNILPKYEINTINRVAGFLAECGHESLDFTVLHENLNYSAQSLLLVFRKYFTSANVSDYARRPENIANRVYANRMGNGGEESGDGYKYRGRGAIQITGYNNYVAFATSIDKEIDETIAYCETLEGAVECSCWFWNVNNVNKYADIDDCDGMSDVINLGHHTPKIGDSIGYADRLARYTHTKKVLQS